jgi:hypothetical protein
MLRRGLGLGLFSNTPAGVRQCNVCVGTFLGSILGFGLSILNTKCHSPLLEADYSRRSGISLPNFGKDNIDGARIVRLDATNNDDFQRTRVRAPPPQIRVQMSTNALNNMPLALRVYMHISGWQEWTEMTCKVRHALSFLPSLVIILGSGNGPICRDQQRAGQRGMSDA